MTESEHSTDPGPLPLAEQEPKKTRFILVLDEVTPNKSVLGFGDSFATIITARGPLVTRADRETFLCELERLFIRWHFDTGEKDNDANPNCLERENK